MENLFTPNKIRLYSGTYFDPFEPDIDLIKIEDIAHGLSLQCRFGGHTHNFFSVAQHSCNVHLLHGPNDLAGLLHDAQEAYLIDIPSPLKSRIIGYKEAEDNLAKMIAEKFQFQYPLDESVKKADKWALQLEWELYVLTPGKGLTPKQAEMKFLWEFNNIKGR